MRSRLILQQLRGVEEYGAAWPGWGLGKETVTPRAFLRVQDRGPVCRSDREACASGNWEILYGKANEALGTATLASPCNRLAWLPAHQHLLAALTTLRTWDGIPRPLARPSVRGSAGLCALSRRWQVDSPGMSRPRSRGRVHPTERGYEILASEW